MTDDAPQKKKFSLKAAFQKVARAIRIMPAVLLDTLKDMRKPREIGLVLTGIIVPGGLIAYGVYRVAIWRRKCMKNAANDNTQDPSSTAEFNRAAPPGFAGDTSPPVENADPARRNADPATVRRGPDGPRR